ncbi:MAG: FimB/Mfa2 family fimbrial subunit [Bacteroidaceae bacterium]|nr:FimB/Mfa2 family fimbrial subunit [Bacteroidaceae bacterium]
MKKIFFLLASVMILTACQNDSEEQPATKGEGRLTFQIVNYEQFSLDDETTRGTDALTIDSLSYLDMAVYDANTDTLVSHQHQAKGANGYATFSATLPYGKYNVVLLGYEGSRQAIVTSPTNICFADDFVPDFFYKTLAVTIDKPETTAQNVALQRSVAAFTINSQGQNPANLDSLAISSQGGSHHFNALTGKGATVEERTYTYNMSGRAGKNSFLNTFFTFLTEDECTMNFTATAYDAQKNVLRTRQFTDVPMKVNQRTRYTGNFFTADQSAAGFTLSLDYKKWEDKDFNY